MLPVWLLGLCVLPQAAKSEFRCRSAIDDPHVTARAARCEWVCAAAPIMETPIDSRVRGRDAAAVRRVRLLGGLGSGASLIAVVLASAGMTGSGENWEPANGAPGTRCASCHTFERGLSHPVDVAPSMAVPEGLPLEGGKITCVTCHDEDGASGHTGARRRGESFLRKAGELSSLCTQCHAADSTVKGSHGAGMKWAHLLSSENEGDWGMGELDRESQSCMACHDGAAAGDAGSHEPGLTRLGEESREHPIGVKFEHRRGEEDEVRLVSRAALDRRIRLFDQSVGCGSCHSVYSKSENLLVMSNARSQLCLGCHVE